jgi:hypothetical protein
MGRLVARARQLKGYPSGRQLALSMQPDKDGKVDPARINDLENGLPASFASYHRIATHLGFRNVLELLLYGLDPDASALLRYYQLLPAAMRTDALDAVRQIYDARAARDATTAAPSSGAPGVGRSRRGRPGPK